MNRIFAIEFQSSSDVSESSGRRGSRLWISVLLYHTTTAGRRGIGVSRGRVCYRIDRRNEYSYRERERASEASLFCLCHLDRCDAVRSEPCGWREYRRPNYENDCATRNASTTSTTTTTPHSPQCPYPYSTAHCTLWSTVLWNGTTSVGGANG